MSTNLNNKERIVIMRHAETTWNAPRRRIQGKFHDSQIVLSENGKREALLKRSHIQTPDLLIISPLLRCKLTAEILFGVNFDEMKFPTIILDDLKEIDVGQFEGKYVDELTGDHKKTWSSWRTNPLFFQGFPDGETITEFCHRVLRGFAEVCKHYKNHYPVIYVITHGGPMRVLRCFLENKDLSHFWDEDIVNLHKLELTYNDIKCLSVLAPAETPTEVITR